MSGLAERVGDAVAGDGGRSGPFGLVEDSLELGLRCCLGFDSFANASSASFRARSFRSRKQSRQGSSTLYIPRQEISSPSSKGASSSGYVLLLSGGFTTPLTALADQVPALPLQRRAGANFKAGPWRRQPPTRQ